MSNNQKALELGREIEYLKTFCIKYFENDIGINADLNDRIDRVSHMSKALLSEEGKEVELNLTLKDFGYADGDYHTKCHECQRIFIGDKRASTCKACAKAIYVSKMGKVWPEQEQKGEG